jgi:two-component SAPR family response regulator
MKIIAVDDEQYSLGMLELETEGLEEVEIVGLFQNPREALEFVRSTPVDAALLDIEMPGMGGITLGKELQKCCPGISLIYVTAYKEYAYDAIQLDADGYLLKPFNQEDIRKALAKVWKKAGRQKEYFADQNKVFIRTFGRFEVFVNGYPIEFSSMKAKELLALLVDRKGGIVTTEEMRTYLWEDRPDDARSRNHCRKVLQRLHECLKGYGIDDILVHHSRGRSLAVDRVVCDYYQYLKGQASYRTEFRGEYMTNYSWAEATLSELTTTWKKSKVINE